MSAINNFESQSQLKKNFKVQAKAKKNFNAQDNENTKNAIKENNLDYNFGNNVQVLNHGKLSTIVITGPVTPKDFNNRVIDCYELSIYDVTSNIDLSNIRFESCAKITIENSKFDIKCLEFLRRSFSLTHLTITGPNYVDLTYEFLCGLNLSYLNHLKIEGLYNISPNVFRRFNSNRFIEMQFINCNFSSGSFPISDNLSYLKFIGCYITSDMLVEIGNATYLRTLIIDRSNSLDDHFISNLKCSDTLIDFQITHCRRIKRIRNLSFGIMTNFVIDYCSDIEEISNISIKRCSYYNIARCHQIKILSNIKIGDSQCFQLSSIRDLQKIEDVQVESNDGDITITNFSNLNKLDNVQIGSPSRLNLKLCEQLRTIDGLQAKYITNSVLFYNVGIEIIKHFPGFEYCGQLFVTFCNELAIIQNLKFVDIIHLKINNCNNLTNISNIQSTQPSSFIIRDCNMLFTIENLNFKDIIKFSIENCTHLSSLKNIKIGYAESFFLKHLSSLETISYSDKEKMIIDNYRSLEIVDCQMLSFMMFETKSNTEPIFENLNDEFKFIRVYTQVQNKDPKSYASVLGDNIDKSNQNTKVANKKRNKKSNKKSNPKNPIVVKEIVNWADEVDD